jgi:hypothetical protein
MRKRVGKTSTSPELLLELSTELQTLEGSS